MVEVILLRRWSEERENNGPVYTVYGSMVSGARYTTRMAQGCGDAHDGLGAQPRKLAGVGKLTASKGLGFTAKKTKKTIYERSSWAINRWS